MKIRFAASAIALIALASIAHAKEQDMNDALQAVSPALAAFDKDRLLGDVWQRPGLSKRDRSVVTVAALIARGQKAELRRYLALALDSGVKPSELSEIIMHLAFYTGWGNAVDTAEAAKEVFASRKIGHDELPAASPSLLALNEAAEADRAARVSGQFGDVFPSVVQNTTDMLFKNLWLRPDLAPRDRSLITVSALVATGQVAQIPYHLNRAMDNGLTQAEAGEVFAQLAFYTGWPSVFSAMPLAKDVFEKRKAR